MILFFDTSALAKFFHNEEGTEAVTNLLNSQENEPWILELATLEFISVLHRRFRDKEINEKSLAEAIDGFEVCSLNLVSCPSMIKTEVSVNLWFVYEDIGMRPMGDIDILVKKFDPESQATY